MIQNEWVRPATPADAARVQMLLWGEKLEADFVPREFVVAEDEGRIVGCARTKPLPEGGTELSSLVVAPRHRGRGLARSLATMVLLGARHPVYALTLVPELARHSGFETVAAEDLPASLRAKAAACDAGGRPWLAMRLRRLGLPPLGGKEQSGGADYLDA